ncbi:flagellin N-terminal helical domain-containing protein [Acutalibacter sp. 1XD8-36]|uniref:flagellin N-terminal helical domain-containing protein n=1 Tax=Acutalibacter sp. 1XD8-36 TaxID=2320852 RepID=UPI00141215B3|nr:flagellin [Acutalibacter sp. 1XD8-36]NBJ89207.1 flagellin [Acutalibacter sp. 1XD8-36]
MRIQHNIMSMNAYRNYNNNASALSKNLEKLSSGYKINRAGDDAAGLAISEKMRAQIKGLEAAQKNVKDGISLVKTAEGAMQEIQDMLSRMKYLATQSSNGTYDDEVDRKALQDEVDQLNSEINRIADSANFNGTKLLDGSLAGAGASGGSAATTLETTTVDATTGKFDMTQAIADLTATANGDKVSIGFDISDKNGKVVETVNVEFTVVDDGTTAKLVTADGKEYAATQGRVKGTEVAAAVLSELQKNSTVKGNFNVANNSGKIEFTAKNSGADALRVTKVSVAETAKATGAVTVTDNSMTVSKAPADEYEAVDLSKADIWDGKADTLEDSIFEVSGEKFVFIKTGTTLTDEQKKMLNDAGVGNNYVIAAGATLAAADVTKMATAIGAATGLEAQQGAVAAGAFTPGTTGTYISLKGASGSANGGGLQLQIGDTSDDFNQLNVVVGDLHANAIGVGGVDISSIDGATAAIDDIKNAINTVSAIRGKLGATQNRLEHTANNLSVMTENIQDAESTIRDTDVADEMMAYTKNNILIQSAQAMLAQANAVPQGVLQLLQ